MSIIFLLKGYPRLSETFIAQEILALEKRGLDIRIVSLRFPTDKETHPIVKEIKASVSYLPEYLHQEPLRIIKAWWKVRRLPGYRLALRQWLKDLKRDFTTNRGRRFGQALVLTTELPSDTTHLHAHFLHTPASVAYYTHLLTGLPWTCSAHAKDIWTIPEWEKIEKLENMEWLVTCTRSGHAHLQDLAKDKNKVSLVYHGMDFKRFPAPEKIQKSGNEIVLLSVGRAVAKKGYDDLLEALALLPKNLNWQFRHIGGGPLTESLKEQAARLGLGENIVWLGAQAQEKVLQEYKAADIFVLASKIAQDGDRDGLPNVLMEAQSQKLAIIATNISGIPELIIDGKTGILVAPNDPIALAQAIKELCLDPQKRQHFSEAGFERVRKEFSLDDGIDDLEYRFNAS